MALLAGVAALIWQILFYSSYETGPAQFDMLTTTLAYLLLVAVAIAALARVSRPVIIGLLQGMCWPALAFVAADVVDVSIDHAYRMFSFSGRYLAGYWTGIASDVLAAGAVILLVQSWTRDVRVRRPPSLSRLHIMLLCSVGLSQIATGVFAATQVKQASSYTLAIGGLVVGLAVTWYATALEPRVLGGALVLGWAVIDALTLAGSMVSWTISGVLGCLLYVLVMILAIVYMRRPSAVLPQHSPSDQ